MDKKENNREEGRDWKFIIGTVILAAVMILMGTFFWRTVADQAALVKEEEAREEAQAVNAIYMHYGDVFKTGIFVDMNTKQLFTAEIPAEGIVNKKGTMIHGDVLEEGDMVRIYGDNVISPAEEGQLPVYENISRMQRTGRATLEEAEEYRRIVKEASGPEKQ